MQYQPTPLPFNRKRSAARSSSSDDDEQFDETLEPLKRNRTQGDLECLGLSSPEQSWHFNVAEVLDLGPQWPPHGEYQSVEDAIMNNMKDYDAERSMYLLCVVGEMRVHHDALVHALPNLLRISPNLQTLVLTPPNCNILSQSGPSRPTLSTVQVSGSSASAFLKLGLLHPLGGGQQPLDAIVVIDANKRRRLVIPFGWGAGRHVRDPTGGRIVVERLMAVLEDGIRQLEREGAR